MDDIRTCENCGCCEEELFELEINGETRLVCADCAKAEGFRRCTDCDEWVLEEDGYYTYDGRFICEDCYMDDYFTCEDCGNVFPLDDEIIVNEDQGRWAPRYSVCQSCADENYNCCDDCGNYVTDNYCHTDDHNTICCNCYDAHYYTCESCGRIVHDDDVCIVNDHYYCEDCRPDDESENFHDYNYKPAPDFRYRSSERDTADILTFGAELEVDMGDDHSELCDELSELGQPIYMKHDGSLGKEGVEIVTHPCSLQYQLYELRWAEITRVCEKHGYKSHDAKTCGLHIHVGRRAFGPTCTDRLDTANKLVLLADRLKGDLTIFSRRGFYELDRWACFPDMGIYSGMSEDQLLEAAAGTRYDRYHAVNLRNDATVEFRLFRGTLKRSTIAASFQLVSNLVKYAMSHTAHECAFEASFADILAVEQFKELNTYAAQKGLM